VVDSQALAAPSYVAYDGLNLLTVKVGTFNAEVAVTGIRSASVKIERTMDGNRPGAPGAYPEPIMIDQGVSVTGTIAPDFQAKADFADRFLAGTTPSMVVQWTGASPSGGGANLNTISVQCPKVTFREAVPGIDGPEVVKGSVAFEAMLDTTNGLVLANYISTDTTV
jgi:hypothetical protein